MIVKQILDLFVKKYEVIESNINQLKTQVEQNISIIDLSVHELKFFIE